MKTKTAPLLCSVAAALVVQATSAATVIVHAYSTGTASRLWVADTSGGPATPAPSPFGVDLITDIAQACNGTIYAVDFTNLYRLDPSGTALRVNPTNSHGYACVGLDFAADGTLFGITRSGQVLLFDTTAGTAQQLFQSAFTYTGDIAFAGMDDTTYTFYASAQSGKIVRITINRISPAGSSEVPATNLIASGESFAAMDFVSGTLTAIAISGNIYAVDPISGVGTLIGQITGPPNFGGMTAATQPIVLLTIARTGTSTQVSWRPPLTNFALEATMMLPSAIWTQLSSTPTISNGTATVTLDSTNPVQFFRLTCRESEAAGVVIHVTNSLPN